MTDRDSEVDAWLDDRAEGMAALVEALVRGPTENQPGREVGRCARILREALDRLGFSRARPQPQPRPPRRQLRSRRWDRRWRAG